MQGEVRYKLSADNKEFREAFKEASGHVDELGNKIKEGVGLGAGIELFHKLEEAVKGALEAIPEMVEHLAGLGHELENLHERTGISTDALQKWKFAGDIVGVSVDSMALAVGKFDKGLDKMAPNVVDALQRIGLSAQSVAKMSDDMKVDVVMSHLGRIEAGATRTAIAMELFGKAGAGMLPLAAQFGSLKDAAAALGAVMDEKTLKAAADLHKESTTLGAVIEGLKNNFAAAIVTSGPLHDGMNALIKVFGILSIAVKNNEESIRGLIRDGLLMLSSGIALTLEGISLFVEGFTKVKTSALAVGAALQVTALGFEFLQKVKDHPLDAAKAFDELKAKTQNVKTALGLVTQEANDQAQSFNGMIGKVMVVNANFAQMAAGVHGATEAVEEHTRAGASQEAELKRLADAHEMLILQIRSAEEAHKRMIPYYEQQIRLAELYGKDLLALAQTHNKVAELMTTATMTGAQKRQHALDEELQKELFNISELRTKDATAKAQMAATTTAAFTIMKNAAQGYFANATLFAEANGFKTRAEMQQSADAARVGYEQMKASGLFTFEELKRAHAAMIKAQDTLNGTHTLATMEKFEIIANAAHSLIKSIFGKSKAGAIAMAVVDTAQAVVKTLAAYPWPWNLIPAAAVAVAGAVEISKIKGQDTGFRQGTPGLGFMDFGDGTPTVLHGREAVVPESRAHDFAAMFGGGRSNSGGGGAPSQVHVYVGNRQLSDVTVEQINSGRGRISGARVGR